MNRSPFEALYRWRMLIRVRMYDGYPCNCQNCTVRRILRMRAQRRALRQTGLAVAK